MDSKGRIAISGASGMVGTHLVQHLRAEGYEIVRLVRRASAAPDEAAWSPSAGTVEHGRLEGTVALVHLAGENLGEGRWSAARKQRIWDSRVLGTRTLARALLAMKHPPRVWLSVSGINYYRESGDAALTESSPAGDDFLGRLCRAWEAETEPARDVTRVVRPRLGVVLSKEGGALAKMLPFFRLGLGGKVGRGDQYMSWIGMHDLCRAFQFCIEDTTLRGAVNFVAPTPVTNATFTQALSRALSVPAVLPVPSFAVRLAFGEFASEALSSRRVEPRELLEHGFQFTHSEVGEALARELAP